MNIKAIIICWLSSLPSIILTFEANVDWTLWGERINESGENSVIESVIKHWSSRPNNFFQSIQKRSWKMIINQLSIQEIEMIRPEEFKSSKTACKEFVRYLPYLSNAEMLPTLFRKVFYGQLFKYKEHEIKRLAQFIPSKWIEKDGTKAVKALISLQNLQLGLLSIPALTVLLGNVKNSCQVLTASALNSVGSGSIEYVTPECIKVIKDLDKGNLSPIMGKLPYNSFTRYNGPLSKETLGNFTDDYLKSYGSSIEEGSTICQSLELYHVPSSSFNAITTRCLHGYLSKRWNRGLGNRWSRISPEVILSFPPEARFSWANIDPSDFNFMPKLTRQILFSVPYTCTTIEISTISTQVIGDMPARCIYTILSKPGTTIKLGNLWQSIPSLTLRFLPGEMMAEILRNLDVGDFYHMPRGILQVILDSDIALKDLPKPLEDLRIPPTLDQLFLTGKKFSNLSKVIPHIAGQLLVQSKTLPNDILAYCDGVVLRNLYYFSTKGEKVQWNDLLSQLAKREEGSFGKAIITLMSTQASTHFCSTIVDLNEYLSLTWLHYHMSDACRANLPFSLRDAFLLLKAPELAYGKVMVPWEEMLEVYTLSDWVRLSNHKTNHLFIILGEVCEFWSLVTLKYSDFLQVIDRKVLRSVRSNCVFRLRKILDSNCNVISFFASNAFSMFKSGESSCKLKDFSFLQIPLISNYHVKDLANPSLEERSQSFLYNTTEEDLVSLGDLQFVSLLNTRKVFIHNGIIDKVVKWWFDSSVARINQFILEEKSRAATIINGGGESEDINNVKKAIQALTIYALINQSDNFPSGGALDLIELVTVLKDSPSSDKFANIFSKFPWSMMIPIAFARNVDEFHTCLKKIMEKIERPSSGGRIELSFNRETGFDRASILQILYSSPKIFASPHASIIVEGLENAGGPTRVLVSQLLTDIERDLIGQEAQIFKEGGTTTTLSGNDGGALFDRPVGDIELASSAARFVWGISGEVGFIVGLVLGKALQLDMKLPFALDPTFYKLLITTDDETIEEYYKLAYAKDFREFEGYLALLLGTDDKLLSNHNEALSIITRPEFIRFTTLSTRVSFEDAKSDYSSKTNIWSCGEREGFDGNFRDFEGGTFLVWYYSRVREKFLFQFKLFIRELVRGLSFVLPPMKQLGRVPNLLLEEPFMNFLSSLLNADPVKAQDVIGSVEFIGDEKVQSFTKSQTIEASKVIIAFIRCLNKGQLSHLVGIWTGASTLSLKHVKLKVLFLHSNGLEPAKFDFCRPVEEQVAKEMSIITPGKDYLEVFSNKFIPELPGASPDNNTIPLPDCTEGGVEMFIGRFLTCNMFLTIYLQPAQSLFNSLVFMLNTRLTNIRDR